MGKVRVSVIVPGYNVEEYIEKCLDSLVSQTLDGIQVIMANDGSTDITPRIMDEYANMYDKDYIKFADNISEIDRCLGKALGTNNCIYDNQPLSGYYDLICKEI